MVPELTTDRLKLRAHRESDLEPAFNMWSNDSVVRYTGGARLTSHETWKMMLRYGGLWMYLGYGYWVIEERDTGAFVGEAGFADFKRPLEPEIGSLPEAGWAIHPDYAGRGYATEAMGAACDWLDHKLRAERSFCLIDPDNRPSIRVAQKLGFSDSIDVKLREEANCAYFRARLNTGGAQTPTAIS